MVSVVPEIKIYNRGEKDKEGEKPLEEFLLLASDGLWDVFENIQEAGKFFIEQLLVVSSSFEQASLLGFRGLSDTLLLTFAAPWRLDESRQRSSICWMKS